MFDNGIFSYKVGTPFHEIESTTKVQLFKYKVDHMQAFENFSSLLTEQPGLINPEVFSEKLGNVVLLENLFSKYFNAVCAMHDSPAEVAALLVPLPFVCEGLIKTNKRMQMLKNIAPMEKREAYAFKIKAQIFDSWSSLASKEVFNIMRKSYHRIKLNVAESAQAKINLLNDFQVLYGDVKALLRKLKFF